MYSILYTLMSKKISERLISSLTYQSYLLDSRVNITDTDFVAFKSSGASNRLIIISRLPQMSICPCKVYRHEINRMGRGSFEVMVVNVASTQRIFTEIG